MRVTHEASDREDVSTQTVIRLMVRNKYCHLHKNREFFQYPVEIIITVMLAVYRRLRSHLSPNRI